MIRHFSFYFDSAKIANNIHFAGSGYMFNALVQQDLEFNRAFGKLFPPPIKMMQMDNQTGLPLFLINRDLNTIFLFGHFQINES
ncbi:MAG: hypothetical protein U9R19_18800 [Bacteroidota bacterium]|nr:hypothetical protein [Bacteroidota bacterium]